ncbi:hypothetical protein TREES_T100021487 [Tupaia chinensis]|uniref:Uncharacterized protein n=1 Tax=Tupaia chinensis TaxID=246437 RepID=L9KHE1_TUPCH|nr:hypothetical protein TREES_T100021487 [Tupaia chinensis]
MLVGGLVGGLVGVAAALCRAGPALSAPECFSVLRLSCPRQWQLSAQSVPVTSRGSASVTEINKEPQLSGAALRFLTGTWQRSAQSVPVTSRGSASVTEINKEPQLSGAALRFLTGTMAGGIKLVNEEEEEEHQG